MWKKIKIVHFYSKNMKLQRIRQPLRKLDFMAENPSLDPVPAFCLKKHNETKYPKTLPACK